MSEMMKWPYPIRYGIDNEESTDVLILGGGIAGCWAAISAAKKGAKVTIVEKGATIRSGAGGSGCDHWHFVTTHPACKVDAIELTEAIVSNHGGYNCGIHRYIQCRESYDTLLELEQMGVKIRDTDGEFKGADFWDEKTKMCFAHDYENKYIVLIWGTMIKPVLYKECKQLGVKIFDRVAVTSILTERGKQGAKVVGATGINSRSGEFYVFKSKATICCMGNPESVHIHSTEFNGSGTKHPVGTGDGQALAWRAGAEFSGMEKSHRISGSFRFPVYGIGSPLNEWHPCSIVDANGKEVPWFDRDGKLITTIKQRAIPSPGQKFFLSGGGTFPSHDAGTRADAGMMEYRPPNIMPIEELNERVRKGEFTPPFYADLPSMPEKERRKIFGLSMAQEGKTLIPVYYNYTRAGFDPDKDMLQCDHMYGRGVGPSFWHAAFGGGMVIDWDLRTSLEGLYAAGTNMLTGQDHSNAATTGKYAGRKAAEYALCVTNSEINRRQVEEEKARVYALVDRKSGYHWKEVDAGLCRVMQFYCADYKNEEILKIGLRWLKELREGEADNMRAENPHELTRALGVLSALDYAEMVIQASLARKASSSVMGFFRSDYSQDEPSDWHKWITLKQVDGDINIGELPINYWGNLEENYKKHCGL